MTTTVVQTITKDCPLDTCRIHVDRGGSTTLLGWTPVYDKNGVRLNHNPNKTDKGAYCDTCGKHWVVTTQDGKDPVVRLL